MSLPRLLSSLGLVLLAATQARAFLLEKARAANQKVPRACPEASLLPPPAPPPPKASPPVPKKSPTEDLLAQVRERMGRSGGPPKETKPAPSTRAWVGKETDSPPSLFRSIPRDLQGIHPESLRYLEGGPFRWYLGFRMKPSVDPKSPRVVGLFQKEDGSFHVGMVKTKSFHPSRPIPWPCGLTPLSRPQGIHFTKLALPHGTYIGEVQTRGEEQVPQGFGIYFGKDWSRLGFFQGGKLEGWGVLCAQTKFRRFRTKSNTWRKSLDVPATWVSVGRFHEGTIREGHRLLSDPFPNDPIDWSRVPQPPFYFGEFEERHPHGFGMQVTADSQFRGQFQTGLPILGMLRRNGREEAFEQLPSLPKAKPSPQAYAALKEGDVVYTPRYLSPQMVLDPSFEEDLPVLLEAGPLAKNEAFAIVQDPQMVLAATERAKSALATSGSVSFVYQKRKNQRAYLESERRKRIAARTKPLPQAPPSRQRPATRPSPSTPSRQKTSFDHHYDRMRRQQSSRTAEQNQRLRDRFEELRNRRY